MIAIVDYGMGNIKSVLNALQYIGEDPVVTTDLKQIDDASHLILPGVGAFGDAMKNLFQRGLVEILNRQVFEKGKPLLGICLGLQLMAKNSQEHGHYDGLGWLDAEVVKFKSVKHLKIPHMGWNDICLQNSHPLFLGIKKDELSFYFVHSYHIVCNKPENIVATCEYGVEFAAVICRDNIVATQFHPEKSQDNGIQLLENYIKWRPC